jgi:predicted HTH domain antitoxin
MPLVISDEVLRAAQLTEKEALVEFACRLFEAGRLSLGHAGEIAGLSKSQMEKELIARDIPRYVYTPEMLEKDIQALKMMEGSRDEGDHK